MNTFKKGDRVALKFDEIDYPTAFLSKGDIYTVSRVFDEFVRLEELGENVGGFLASRFELVSLPKVGDTVSLVITHTGVIDNISDDYIILSESENVLSRWSQQLNVEGLVVTVIKQAEKLPNEPGTQVEVRFDSTYAGSPAILTRARNGYWYMNTTRYTPEDVKTFNWKVV